MKLELQDKIAIVTGASKGIGLAVVEALCGEGAHVVAGARHSSPELDALADTGKVTVVTVDLSENGGPADLVRAAGDRIDVLVNNVGAVQPRLEGFLSVTDAQWEDSFNLNFMAGGARDAGGLAGDARRWAGFHREHQFGQCLPA